MLTDLQKKMREGRLTASRVAALMTGDVVKIVGLYAELIGEAVEDDLRDNWPVRLGEATEQLNLDWAEHNGWGLITNRGRVVVHSKYDWACATLDGWSEKFDCPIEVKHVGGREPLEVVIERYQPQLQWQMECTGAKQALLSVIMGASEPIVETLERDDAYIAEMVKRGAQFMDCVAKRRPPVVLPPVAAPIVADKTYDMTGNNVFADNAGIWLDTRDAAKKNEDAKAVLKSMVPADAKKVVGYGVRITRARASGDRVGALSLREDVA